MNKGKFLFANCSDTQALTRKKRRKRHRKQRIG